MRLPERATGNPLHRLRQQKENPIASFCEMGTRTRTEKAFLAGCKVRSPDAEGKAPVMYSSRAIAEAISSAKHFLPSRA